MLYCDYVDAFCWYPQCCMSLSYVFIGYYCYYYYYNYYDLFIYYYYYIIFLTYSWSGSPRPPLLVVL